MKLPLFVISVFAAQLAMGADAPPFAPAPLQLGSPFKTDGLHLDLTLGPVRIDFGSPNEVGLFRFQSDESTFDEPSVFDKLFVSGKKWQPYVSMGLLIASPFESAGLRLDLPVGPVRIDYRIPLQRDHFSSGSGGSGASSLDAPGPGYREQAGRLGR